jgi:hypothetical protein
MVRVRERGDQRVVAVIVDDHGAKLLVGTHVWHVSGNRRCVALLG